ncbi:IS30 family transposase [Desulfosediminicola ganghwensis]|uniref:IS30 family transposase n=1 Tax=Desulfosediminicola ganghwensis TaxID=2569540 RepID=UPI0010ABC9FC|nr:IS30 family transposase [Desulfosediminicola ganghwensis]
MTQKRRNEFSSIEMDEVWRRWRKGESFSEIGRAVGRAPGTIHGMLQLHGGISPPKRKRSMHVLTLFEREEISRGIAASHSIRCIARHLGRPASTVSREIKRHGGSQAYRAVNADKNAWDSARRPKPCKLGQSPTLLEVITDKILLQWSPEQISGWLKKTYPADDSMQISHETIYRSLFIQARGVLKKELLKHLRTGRKMRQSKQFNTKGVTRGQIIDGLSIRERPKEVEDRSVPGHWEGDLIAGSHNTHIATLVERQSRFTMLVKVFGKDTLSVTNAIRKQILHLPENLRKTITWDRGMELAYHKKFTVATGVKVYFCDPQSPWQRGTNENTNSLIRQYLPKKTDLSVYSQTELNELALRLNQRPRKTLGYLTPADMFWGSVALTY